MTFMDPVGNLLIHPPIGFLRRAVIPGVISGSGDLTRPTGALPPFNNVNAYGLSWSIFSIPAGFGKAEGFPDVYYERLVQLSTVHEDFEGHQMISEYHDFHAEGLYWLWETAGPKAVHYEVTPGVELVVYWLEVRIP